MSILKLAADDYAVYALTMATVKATANTKPSLTLRCATKHCVLGHIGSTLNGPLMTSSWQVETEPPFKINADGVDLGRAQSIRKWRTMGTVTSSGAPNTYTDRHGVIALLTIQPGLTPDFPDLLVRCPHGDAVLDRRQALDWYQTRTLVKVHVSMPLHEYAPLRPTLVPRKRRGSETRKFGDAGGRTPEEVRDLLRYMGHDL